jgi:hypothetical protein
VTALAPAAVVEALTTQAEVAAVCEWGCAALDNIAVSEAGSAACVDARAPAAVVAALSAHANSYPVYLYALSTLSKMNWSNPVERDDFIQTDAANKIRSAVNRFIGSDIEKDKIRKKANAALEKLGPVNKTFQALSSMYRGKTKRRQIGGARNRRVTPIGKKIGGISIKKRTLKSKKEK